MKKQAIIALVGIVMIVAIGMLWLRVRSLEATVDALNQRLQTNRNVVTVGEAKSDENAEGKPIFKLIESAKHNDKTTNVGVPWDVERAMMGEANTGEASRFDPSRIVAPPESTVIEPMSPPKMNLDFLEREPGSD